MPVRKVTDIAEMSIVAAAAGYPDSLPISGSYVEANNKRYLLALRDGIYQAWDISVYADNGSLLTGPLDVWVNAAGEVVQESIADFKKLGYVALAVAAGYFLLKLKK
jgi:hypothetical protein